MKTTSKNNIIIRDNTFQTKHTHLGNGECEFCGLQFPHIHEEGGKRKDFVHILDYIRI